MRFEDLLSARILHRQRPDLRRVIARALTDLDATAAEGLGHTLLAVLRERGAVPGELVEQVYGLVDRARRGRALGIYLQLLVGHGLPEPALDEVVRRLGERADVALLGEAVIGQGLLDPEREAELRFQARVAFDHDATRQVDDYRQRTRAEQARTMVGGEAGDGDPSDTGAAVAALEQETVPSGVFRLGEGPLLPDAGEATGIIDAARVQLRPLTEIPPPRFPVPEWIDTSHPMAGRVVGEYRILGKVGAGAMATVFLADHGDRQTPVAIKLLPPGASAERQARFKREILANGFFQHENVIDVYDAGTTPDGYHYLAMEFFDGEDLQEVLAARGSVSLHQALLTVRQVGQALAGAHRAGIVHRDVKPSNILVSQDGRQARLMDFGIALIKDLGDFKDKVFESEDGGITGTPEYLSPEQAFRDPVGPASDLYSLGLVLYRMLAGRSPFQADSARGWISAHITDEPLPLQRAVPGLSLPPELPELLERLLVKDPRQRLQSAEELVATVERLLRGLGGATGRWGRGVAGLFRRGL